MELGFAAHFPSKLPRFLLLVQYCLIPLDSFHIGFKKAL